MSHDFSCACGQMRWQVRGNAPGRHIACYCADCQSFARHLGHTGTLSPGGGTHLFQTIPHALHFTALTGPLAVLRLHDEGLLRWYAGCCNTPIANTLAKPHLPFVGMILPPPGKGFGPVRAHVHTKSAVGDVKGSGLGFALTGITLMARALTAIGTGKTQNPFFDTEESPIATPRVLSLLERRAARGLT